MRKALFSLFERVDACESCRKARNPLRHVLGGGQMKRPRFALVFINPTHRNRSSHPSYAGSRRYPFIGVRHFYRFLADAGFLKQKTVAPLYERGWQLSDERRIEADLARHQIYLTNLVKCAQPHPRYPSADAICAQLPLLTQELRLVSPRYIVAFGGVSIKALTGTAILLRDVLQDVRARRYSPQPSLGLAELRLPVLPCFFPLGHGNPPKALEVLRFITQRFR